MDKKTDKPNILDDKVYEEMLKVAREKRAARHKKARENTTTAVRTTKVWVISHS